MKLALKVGHEAGAAWKLVIEAGPRKILEETIDDRTAPGGWRELEVDLGIHPDGRAWILVRAEAGGAPARSFWKRLAVR